VRLAYTGIFVLLLLVLAILYLSPKQSQAESLLRLITIAASWPVVAGSVLITCFVVFRSEISSYMKYAKVKYGELELSAHQPATPAAALATVAMAGEDSNALAQPHDATDLTAGDAELVIKHRDEVSAMKAWVAQELENRSRELRSWKNLYLDQFLVDSARAVIGWLNNFTAVPEAFYDSSWHKLIPQKLQRSRILQTLLDFSLVRRDGVNVALTSEGQQYLEHVYASTAAAGRPLPLPHPFVSRDDVKAYGRLGLNPHSPVDDAKDENCHHYFTRVPSTVGEQSLQTSVP